jgi:ATP-dependent DNA helicase RecG
MTASPETLARLQEWMNGKEGENCEFKAAKQGYHADDLGKYACALANEGGGKIILGVTDKRPRQVCGTRAFDQPERTRKGLCEKMPLGFDFEEIHHPNGRVLVFKIPPRPIGTPIKYSGRYWMREQDSLVEMNEDRLREIFAESGHDFSADVCTGATLADLDQYAIEEFRRRWIEKAKRADNTKLAQRLAGFSPGQLLHDAEAVIDGRITHAAIILFGTRTSITKYLPQAEVVFEYRSSDASGPAQDRREFRRGFFGFYNKLWNAINARNDKQSFQDGLYVFQVLTFNRRTVREVILNAASHRDYQLAGSIFIRQYPRRLEIDSPGGFPLGITLDNMLDRQKPRNRRIADIFLKCGLVERSGQGMNLIFEEAVRMGKLVPDFDRTDRYQVGLTLHGTVQNPNFVRFLEKVGQETTATFGTRDWLILDLIAREQKLTAVDQTRLQRMSDLGVIEKAGGRRYMLSRRYYTFAGQKGTYTRKRGLDHEHNLALLLKHIKDNAELGSPRKDLVQVLPGLSEEQVKALLRTLRSRGDIHREGEKRGARWFPGGPGPRKSGN